ncbi:hypothetical protein CesoFtcFv8_004662 [Champsocephalus esox]|uniref:Uncharacterized protein n=2 Tax=Champsocephalus TaxID=52236 RepID=A0AAN8E0X9_CHAGU|nr:hypothetical protein CesoFtcFv8_004662 [Champsocephalus esox]KAK5930318.1 hypothetical protein CgunFtcFv8_026563 [Champsocephalus gunnari]
MGGCREGGGETRFLTGAGVLLSCNLSSDSKERSKRGPARGPGGGRRRGAGAGGEAKGHAEGGERPDSLSCSLPRNVLCGMGRVLQPLLWGPHWHLWEHRAPCLNDPQPPSPPFVGVSQHT